MAYDLTHLRTILKVALESMEQGRFQELILRFLPLYDSKYTNLRRHGATVTGKTRKGTPDSLSTSLNDGQQIGVQCSTEEGYWDFDPKNKNVKPFHDIDRCKDELSRIQEIVLCSNREIPTKRPNAKSDVVSYAKSKEVPTITLFSLEDLESIFFDRISDPAFFNLFEHFFPDIAQYITTLQDAERSITVIKMSKMHPQIPLASVEEICNLGFKDVNKNAQEFISTELNNVASRFLLKKIPIPGLTRILPLDYPLLKPIGKVMSFLGVPKIGKSNLIYQCSEIWTKEGVDLKIYICPEDAKERVSCVDEILYRVYSFIMPSDRAADLIAGRINLEEHFQDFNPQKTGTSPKVFVIDDAELLSEDDFKRFCRFLHKVQPFLSSCQIGLIFISNKSLRSRNTIFDPEISVHPWNSEELHKLLALNFKANEVELDMNYAEMLETMSTGHPLIALALAKKYPTKRQLVECLITNSFVLPDDLSTEGKQFLFDDLLKDDKDSLMLVCRLTPLIFRSKINLLQAIGQKIKPEIGKPVKLLISKLSGTVIEGEDTAGYTVVPFYRKIADTNLTIEDKKAVYDVASDFLLSPPSKTIDIVDILDGINYAIMALKFDLALSWSIQLLHIIFVKKTFPIRNQIRVKSVGLNRYYQTKFHAGIFVPNNDFNLKGYNVRRNKRI